MSQHIEDQITIENQELVEHKENLDEAEKANNQKGLNVETENLKEILSASKEMYGHMLDNSRALDTKTSILLAILCITLFRAIDMITLFREIANYLRVISSACSAMGLILSFWAIRLRKYIFVPDVVVVEEYYNKNVQTDLFRAQMFASYKDAVVKNASTNGKKAFLLVISYWLTMVSVLSLITSEIWEIIK